MHPLFLTPDWPAPAGVRAIVTTRQGGTSLGPFDTLNLADYVGDNPQAVATNRAYLRQFLPSEPYWLDQVHGIQVVDAGNSEQIGRKADAAFSFRSGVVCVVLSADCLPVLFCDRDASVVAAAHAGWRGLCDGVLAATVSKMQKPAQDILAWMGPAIGPLSYEVGAEIYDAFVSKEATFEHAFLPLHHDERAGITQRGLTIQEPTARPQKWMANLYEIARRQLALVGVTAVYGGNFCTYTEKDRFFSYRRDGKTGRMASLIWLD